MGLKQNSLWEKGFGKTAHVGQWGVITPIPGSLPARRCKCSATLACSGVCALSWSDGIAGRQHLHRLRAEPLTQGSCA